MQQLWRAIVAVVLLVSLALGFRAFWIGIEMILLWPYATLQDELRQFALAFLYWTPAILIAWQFRRRQDRAQQARNGNARDGLERVR